MRKKLYSSQYTADHFQRLWPNDETRRQVAGHLTQSIYTANRISPKCWALCVHPARVRLNVGQIAVLEFGRAEASIYSLSDGLIASETSIFESQDWRGYKAIKASTARYFVPISDLPRLGPLFDRAHSELIVLAALSKKSSPFRASHSRALVEWLEDVNSRPLPQPGYAMSEDQEVVGSSLALAPAALSSPQEIGESAPDSKDSRLLARYAREGLVDEVVRIEGLPRSSTVRKRSRSSSLRARKIAAVMNASPDGRLRCEVPGCGFDFEQIYGVIGKGFAHVHHLTPFGGDSSERETKLSDLAVVCANCHAMIHIGGENRTLNGLIVGQ